jgi:hypothetical protein
MSEKHSPQAIAWRSKWMLKRYGVSALFWLTTATATAGSGFCLYKTFDSVSDSKKRTIQVYNAMTAEYEKQETEGADPVKVLLYAAGVFAFAYAAYAAGGKGREFFQRGEDHRKWNNGDYGYPYEEQKDQHNTPAIIS